MNLFELFVKIGVDDQASGALGNITSKLGNGLKTAAKVGTAAIAAASTAIVAFGASSVKAGMEFDSSMAQVAATMGTTVDQIENLREFAQEMGRTTAFSAVEAADALNYMALAGYDAETAMATLPTVLDLAAAGSIDLAYASDMVTDAQSALGLSLEESAAMVDQMAQTASKSNTSVAQLGEAILTVGGTAQYMAGGTEQVNTVLGILADNGIKGAEAGTHLRNMLLSLSAPTEAASSTLEDLGVQIFNAEGEMRDFADIFPELNEAMSTLTDQEKLDAFSTIFNTRDIAAATALLNTSVERWDELGSAIEGAEGAASKMAATQLDNLAGDITLFKSALEGARIAISDGVTPALRDFVQFGTDAISQLTASFQEDGIGGAIETFGILLTDGLTSMLQNAPALASAGVSLIQTLMTGISQNLPLLVSAAFEMITTIANGLLEMLPQIVQMGFQLIVSLATGIAQSLPELIPTIIDVILQIITILTDPANLSMLIDASVQIVVAIITGIIAALPQLIAQGPEIIKAIITGILSAIYQLLEAAVEIIVTLVTGLVENFPQIVAAGQEAISSLIEGARSWFSNLIDLGRNIVQQIKDGIAQAWENLKSWFNNLWDELFGDKTVDIGVNAGGETSGSHAGGLPYVPFDRYIAELHRGERVLTAAEAAEYNKGRTGQTVGGIVINQYIETVPQTPVEFAAATAAYFEQARWAF